MNILLIGGNGFIGSHLIDVFLQNKHNVRVFDISMEKYRSPFKEVDYRIFSIENLTALYEAMLDIDIVIHLASISVPSTSNLDTIADVNGNLITSLNILNTVVKAKVKKVIYFSSGGAVYGTIDGSTNENSPLNPISSYGIIKSTVERYFILYGNLYNIDTLIIRPSNPYGPRQGHFIAQGVISTFLKQILSNQSINVFGNGDSKKDYIYIKDLANILYILTTTIKNGIYNIGSGESTSIKKLIEEIKIITKNKPNIIYSENRIYDVLNFTLDISLLKNVIGDFKFTSLHDGILFTWEWMKKYFNENDKNA